MIKNNYFILEKKYKQELEVAERELEELYQKEKIIRQKIFMLEYKLYYHFVTNADKKKES